MFVKICGITSEADALLAVGMGAAAVGFVFAPSPRQMAPAAVADIVKRLPHEMVTVGVFRDEAPQRVVEIANQIGLRAVQLHGVESVEDTRWVASRARLDDQGLPRRAPRTSSASTSTAPSCCWSTGRARGRASCSTGAWPRAWSTRRRLIVSGGLRAGERRGAPSPTSTPGAWTCPAGSRPRPGSKDPGKLREFIAAAHAAARAVAAAAAVRAAPAAPRSGDGRGGRAARTRAVPFDWQDGVVPPAIMGDPGPSGRFGEFGGRFVPESLVPACMELEGGLPVGLGRPDGFHDRARRASSATTAGGPRRSPSAAGCRSELGVRVLLKREDLAHTGSHKLNNVVGQGLLARRMGKHRLIAETGAGQHGVATATAAALFGMECVVYMGEVDTQRQELNVFRMELLGAEVRPVRAGSRTLKDAVNEALRDWVAAVERHALLPRIGDGAPPVPVDGPRVPAGHRRRGPGAVPRAARRRRPRCGGGLRRRGVQRGGHLRRVRRRHVVGAGGGGGGRRGGHDHRHPRRAARHAERAHAGRGGPDPRGPLHLGRARLSGHRPRARPSGRARPGPVRVRPTTRQVLDAFRRLARTEGIIPALESAHAIAWVIARAGTDDLPTGSTVLVNLSGRGDKDVAQVRDLLRS